MDEAGTVFLVDDDESVLRALSRVLIFAGYTVETFPSAAALLARKPCEGPSCLIVDLQMPGQSGLELQREVRKAGWTAPVVFLTAYGDVPSSVRAMREGALDFLTKPVDTALLTHTVQQAIDGHRKTLAELLQLEELRQRFALLTPREQEVCVLVARGLLNKQIADQLGTAEQTVKIHRGRVMTKLMVNTVPELVRLVDRVMPENTPEKK